MIGAEVATIVSGVYDAGSVVTFLGTLGVIFRPCVTDVGFGLVVCGCELAFVDPKLLAVC